MKNLAPIDYAKMACDTKMRMPAEDLPPKGCFHYHAGVFLRGMQKTYELCGDSKYYDYAKKWVDSQICEDGTIIKHNSNHFDDLMAGCLLFMLDRNENDSRYKKALDTLVSDLNGWKKNAKGGYWHKQDVTPDQMWLDGLYMAGSVLSQYGYEFDDKECFDIMHRQMMLMWNNIRDEKTGLMYHACDFSKKMPWANPETGCSSIFWGRAIGWVALIIVDMLDFIPKDYEKRADFVNNINALLKAIARYQDPNSGLWYQVVDKGGCLGNWTEASCSALFTYAINKAVRMGYLEKEYQSAADKGYKGLTDSVVITDGKLYLHSICIGTMVGDYQFYVERPREVNDLHGMGAFLMMCEECSRSGK